MSLIRLGFRDRALGTRVTLNPFSPLRLMPPTQSFLSRYRSQLLYTQPKPPTPPLLFSARWNLHRTIPWTGRTQTARFPSYCFPLLPHLLPHPSTPPPQPLADRQECRNPLRQVPPSIRCLSPTTPPGDFPATCPPPRHLAYSQAHRSTRSRAEATAQGDRRPRSFVAAMNCRRCILARPPDGRPATRCYYHQTPRRV